FEDDYVNHSCNPTGFILMSGSFAAGQDVQAGQVALFATRDIEPGEEITFDYSLNVCASTWKMHIECCCGSTSCRGSILPITELDPAYLAQCAKKRQLSDHMLGHMESLIESLGTQ
ncbi:MAG: SET domain-containing protein-lysine N-methyltransferase, partial [Bdellovibrionales bacterium]|nr:SET domain-containing protein-lysine N-methyltransferase [Bdellovibrionales bacterium]